MMLRAICLLVSIAFMSGAVQAQVSTSQPAPPALSPGSPPVGQGRDGDWAYLSRYKAQNQALPQSTAPRVVFLGDSITEGWAMQPSFSNDKRRVGRGIAGQTAQQMLVRFRADVLGLRPSAVHIMAGTNDVAQNTGPETDDEIFGYVVSLVQLAQANHIPVILASIPPTSHFFWRPSSSPAAVIVSLNDRFRRFAKSEKLTYVDYWTVLADKDGAMRSEYTSDGVHPNGAGFEAMRPLAEAAIAQALKRGGHGS